MKCDIILERFLEADKYIDIPLSIRLHMLFCPHCREEILALKEIFNILKETSSFEMHRDISNSVMQKIIESEILYEHNISKIKWLSVGLIILGSMFLLSFSDSLLWLKSHFGANLLFPLNVVLGLVISLYAILFIGTHVNEIKKYADLLYKKFS